MWCLGDGLVWFIGGREDGFGWVESDAMDEAIHIVKIYGAGGRPGWQSWHCHVRRSWAIPLRDVYLWKGDIVI